MKTLTFLSRDLSFLTPYGIVPSPAEAPGLTALSKSWRDYGACSMSGLRKRCCRKTVQMHWKRGWPRWLGRPYESQLHIQGFWSCVQHERPRDQNEFA